MKGHKTMLNNLEIVMDIDTLEIFEVIDLDEQDNVNTAEEDASEEKQSIPHDDLDNIYLEIAIIINTLAFCGKLLRTISSKL